MNKLNRNTKILFIVILVIGIIAAFFGVEKNIERRTLLANNSTKLDPNSTPSTQLTALSFVGYEGANPTFRGFEDFSEYTVELFPEDETWKLYYEKAFEGAEVTLAHYEGGELVYLDVDAEHPVIETGDALEIYVNYGNLEEYTYFLDYTTDLDLDYIEAETLGFINGYHTYVVPRDGTYKVELWGASGGAGCLISGSTCTTTYNGGAGAYTAGNITLKGGQKLYVYIGGRGTSYNSTTVGQSTVAGGWNGGGRGGLSSTGTTASGAGGGASDIRLVPGSDTTSGWNDEASLKSRIMVAAGGGGGSYNLTTTEWSSSGGGLYVDGLSSTFCSANQVGGYLRGAGVDIVSTNTSRGGGGGGYWGGNGYAAIDTYGGPGCGGSSYISGHPGSIGVDASGNAKTSVYNDISDSYSYTGYVFSDTVMIDGSGHEWINGEPKSTVTGQPSQTGGTETGRIGAGYFRIKQIAKGNIATNYLSNLTASSGVLSPDFSSNVFEYNLTLDTFTRKVTITGEVLNTATNEVTPPTEYEVELGSTKDVAVFVTDLLTGGVQTYTVKITRPSLPDGQHSTLLEKIVIPGEETILVDRNTTNYSFTARYGVVSMDIDPVAYDSDATITIDGNRMMFSDIGTIKITVEDALASPTKTVYTLTYQKESPVEGVPDNYEYPYKGPSYYEFEAPITGEYRLETWGASGGSMASPYEGKGGNGAYASGIVTLKRGDKLYIYVGGAGTGYSGQNSHAGGWNGGGQAGGGASGGGGATDIRITSGVWNDPASLNSRIMVAAGGGGSNDYTNGGAGGILVGETGDGGSALNGSGGTQTSGGVGQFSGSFGYGGYQSYNANDGGAGGGGYYGGARSSGNNTAGGGGSSYVSGYTGAVAVTSERSSTPRVDEHENRCENGTTNNLCSIHYSGLVFKDITIIDGKTLMPTHDGLTYMTGNEGNGYAKITPLSSKSQNNYLQSIQFDSSKVTIDRDFEPDQFEYTFVTGILSQTVNLVGIPYDSNATVTGDGELYIDIGDNYFDIVVTAENGVAQVYNIKVIRQGLGGRHSNAINKVDISGNYTKTIYVEEGIYDYNFRIAYNEYDAPMNIEVFDSDAKVEIYGNQLILANEGTVTVRVYHENNEIEPLEYHFNYTRQLPLSQIQDIYTFNCTQQSANWIAPLDGQYELRVWGARGGGNDQNANIGSRGGFGGYSTGRIILEQGETLDVFVGCQGRFAGCYQCGGGWNGGGGGANTGYGGGGATDMRLNGTNLADRILVAGGGGGADDAGGPSGSRGGSNDGSGGYGGGVESGPATIDGRPNYNTIATQSSGFKMGYGQSTFVNTDTGGGGGGYYGGFATGNNNGGAGGGSGYVDTVRITNGATIPGNASMPTWNLESSMVGNNGDGYATIVPLNMKSNNNYLSDIKFDVEGTLFPEFDPTIFEYTLTTTMYDAFVNLEAVPYDLYATVEGNGKYRTYIGETDVVFTVTSENGTVRQYFLTIVRPGLPEGEHTAELERIEFEGFSEIICEKGVYEYTITIPVTKVSLEPTPHPYDPEARTTMRGFSYIKGSTIATITSRVAGLRATYTIKIEKEIKASSWEFDYTGKCEEFVAPYPGVFQFELWGASGGAAMLGGSLRGLGGAGAYTSGDLKLQQNDTFYICVGQRGNNAVLRGQAAPSFNGGGGGDHDHSDDESGAGGGGATDVRLEPGAWNTESGLNSRIMVAAGGAGKGDGGKGGSAGGALSSASVCYSPGATQTTGYSFGIGKSGQFKYGNKDEGGGGGGYYGGFASGDPTGGYCNGGSGGSSFISGHTGAIAIASATNRTPRVDSNGRLCENGTTDATCSEHYSGWVFNNTIMRSGYDRVPTYDGVSTMVGNFGNGHAKVTYRALSEDNFLQNIIAYVNGETRELTPVFNSEVTDYELILGPEETNLTLSARPQDSTATIYGIGDFLIPDEYPPAIYTDPLEYTYEIKVTAENGDVKTYSINVKRAVSDNQIPDDIIISGLVPSYCKKDENYCVLFNTRTNQKTDFNNNIHEYSMTVPYRIRQLEFEVVKGQYFQTVYGDGVVSLNGGANNETVVSIEVFSERCSLLNDFDNEECMSIYQYHITRDMSGDNDLKTLEIRDPERELTFSPDISEYSTSVPYEYTSIADLVAIPDNELATIEILGNENFELGLNTVRINVTAPNGDMRTYRLYVYREKSDNIYLRLLRFYNTLDDEVDTETGLIPEVEYGLVPIFTKHNLTYTVNIPNDITSVKMESVLDAPDLTTSFYTVNRGIIMNDLGNNIRELSNIPTGVSVLEITNTAQNGTTDSYVININRAFNSNKYLSDLVVKNGELEYVLEPTFNKDTHEYIVTVGEGVTEVQITGTPEVSTSTATNISGNKITVGNNLKTIRVVAEDGSYLDYHINIVRPANTNNFLSDLKVTNTSDTVEYEYTPDFDPDVDTYELVIPYEVSSVKITGVSQSYLSTITKNGSIYAIEVGETAIPVLVTSESGETRTYNLIITRLQSTNPYLKTITTSEGSIIVPEVSRDNLRYTTNVENDVTELTVYLTPEHDVTRITPIGVGVDPIDNTTFFIDGLSTGENEVKIRTLAQDGITSLEYTLVIVRDKSDNTNLSWLLLEEGIISPAFDPMIVEYTATVPYSAESGTFNIELANPAASYNIVGASHFDIGENEVTITVTAEDGRTTKEYKVFVTRQEEETANNYLSNIEVSEGEYTPRFERTRQYYEMYVENEIVELEFTATAEDPDATITGDGVYNLNVGKNVVGIRVTGTDNKTRDYQIVVTRAKSKDARLRKLTIKDYLLSPNFEPDYENYSIITQERKLIFDELVTMHPNATYKVYGNNFDALSGEFEVKIVVTAEDKNYTKTYTINVTKTPNRNSYLEDLGLEDYTITPEFKRGTYLYRATVPANTASVNVYATAENEEATIDGTGIHNLNVGNNYLTVIVTSGAGDETIYTIQVYVEPATDSKLLDITVYNEMIGNMVPSFSPTIEDYYLTVPYEVEELSLGILKRDPDATVTIVDNSLKVGENLVKVVVVAEDGTNETTYNLHVTRNHIISNLLSNLEIHGYYLEPEFDPNILTYDISVNNETESLLFDTITTMDPNGQYKITGNGNFLENQINSIYIDVKSSEDEDYTNRYTIRVRRQGYADNFLSYIGYKLPQINNVERYPTPDFTRENLVYDINVSYEITEIMLTGALESNSNTVTGLGLHSNLRTGKNVFNIVVTSPSGISRTYIVNVYRQKNDKVDAYDLRIKAGNTEYPLTPLFSESIYEYSVDIPKPYTFVEIIGEFAPGTTVSGTGFVDINPGVNNIEVIVTSEDEDNKAIYKITINREVSDNKYLADLIPSSGNLDPPFTFDEFEYDLAIDSATQFLSFEYELLDETGTVTGIDREIVLDGESVRRVVVTAENGDTQTYTINVFKYTKDTAYLKNLYVVGYDITPEFNKEVFEYHVILPNNKMTLTKNDVVAVLEDEASLLLQPDSIHVYTTDESEYQVIVIANDGVTRQTYKIFAIRELGSETRLDSLSTNLGYLGENFNSDIVEYTWLVPPGTPSVSINNLRFIPKDPQAIVTTTDYVDLSDITASHKFVIKVEAEDGSGFREYTLNIQFDYNADNTLSRLNVLNGVLTPAFNPVVTTYDVYEYTDEEEDEITAYVNRQTSRILSGTGTVTLDEEEIVREILVEAEDGSVRKYTLNFHKSIDHVIGLEDLGLEGFDPETCDAFDECKFDPVFREEVIEYHIKVPYEYVVLDLYYMPKSAQQTVKYKLNNQYINDKQYQLPLGDTVINVEVYDGKNKLTTTYKVTIERLLSSNALAEYLQVSRNGKNYQLTPAFDPKIFEYEIDVDKDVDEVSVYAIPQDKNSLVRYNGYNYLQPGVNEVTATIYAPDGTSLEYLIRVIKQPQYNNWLKTITVSTGNFWDLDPEFNKIIFDYVVRVPGNYDQVTVEGVPMDPTTIVTGTGEYLLHVGMNKIVLSSTAVDGSVSNYVVGVIQEPNKIVDLEYLYIDEAPISPEFDVSRIHYTAEVSADTTDVHVHAKAQDPKATIIINGDKGLVAGDNEVEIIVLSQDGTESKTYQIIVSKSVSRNPTLSDIIVTDMDENTYELTPIFDPGATDYATVVPYDVDLVNISVVKTVGNTTVLSGPGDVYLDYGSNEIEINTVAEDGETHMTYKVNVYRAYDLKLRSITPSHGTLDPEFDEDETNFHIDVPYEVDRITINAEPKNQTVHLFGTGTFELSTATDNIFNILAQDRDGNTRTVIVTVTRGKNANNKAELISIKEGALTPVFDSETDEYSVNVRKTLLGKSATFTVIPESNYTTYQIIGNENLQMGPNDVIVRMESDSGDTRDYKVTIILRDDDFFSNKLASLTVDYPDSNGFVTVYNPDFNEDINSYEATVPASIEKVRINATPKVDGAIVTGTGTFNLRLGRNSFNITVTGQDGEKNVYVLIVHRLQDDASLKTLIVRDHPFVFIKNIDEYSINISGDEDVLDILAEPTDPTAEVSIVGNDPPIPSGDSTIEVTVTTRTGATKTYTINVFKGESTNAYLRTLTVSGFDISPEFVKTTRGPYRVTVPNNVSQVVINAEPEVPSTVVTNTGRKTLRVGSNEFEILTVAGDGTSRITYTVIITRTADSSNDLLSLSVSHGELSPEFDPNITEYEVTVPAGTNTIRVVGTIPDSATAEGLGARELTGNTTDLDVVVKAQDGSEKTYTITVKRETIVDSDLAYLKAKNGRLDPEFLSNSYHYSIDVPYEVSSLDLEYAPKDPLGTVIVSGNENFVVGINTVTIRSIASDGETVSTYEISVIKQSRAENFLSYLKVFDENDTTEYPLSPAFDRLVQYYEVTVPYDVDVVDVLASKASQTGTLSGAGWYNLDIGVNTIYVTVRSASGNVRTYVVDITRENEDEKERYLLSLEHDKGTLEPSFDKTINSYTLTLSANDSELTLSGTSSPNTTIRGLGKSNVAYGNSVRTVTVTDINGNVNTYYFNIVRPYTGSTQIRDIIPSSGTLDFDDSQTEFEMTVDGDVEKLSFDVITVDPEAIVSGNEERELQDGDNIFQISVTGANGEVKRITILVVRKNGLEAIVLRKHSIVIGTKENTNVTYTLNPSDTEYRDVVWSSEDPTIASVAANGLITGVSVGTTTIRVTSTYSSTIYDEVEVTVFNSRITSSIHEVHHTDEETGLENNYVTRIDPATAYNDFIANLDNNPEYLHLYAKSGMEVDIDNSTMIGSYMELTIEYDGKEYDRAILVVIGDMSGDGFVTAADITLARNYVANPTRNWLDTLVADVNLDDSATAVDITFIKTFVSNRWETFYTSGG